MTSPQLYRDPASPVGFLGAYDARPMVLCVLGFVVACFVATQYLAWRFGYQPALGAPWVSVAHYGVYYPWCWVQWAWRFRGIADPAVRTPLLIACCGGIGAFCVAYVMSSTSQTDRARKLSQGAQDLHGSAQWATDKDVRATGLLGNAEGVYVGGWETKKGLQYLRDNTDEHVLAFAPTGSSKTVGLVIPTLLAWSDSAVIYDIKGENWAKTAGYRAQQGHLCFKFEPVSAAGGSRFNPLEEIRLFTPRDVSDAQNIAHMLVRTGGDAAQERYWQDAASSIITGMILHVCYAAMAKGLTACLADLSRAFTPLGVDFRSSLLAIQTYTHDASARNGWTTHPAVAEKAQEMLDKEDRDFSGVHSTAKTCLSLYSDPLVGMNTSQSDFSIRDLVDFHLPISFYLVVPPSDEVRLRPLIRLIFTIIVNRLTESVVFEGSAHVKNRHRLLFMIDEFPSLRHMDIFASAMSFMRGFGLKAFLIAQDVRQIVDSYGANESIISNCHIHIAFAPNQIETAEMLSKMTGTRTVERASFSFSGKRNAMSMQNMNAGVDYVERPMLTPDEVKRLPGDAALIFVTGRRPIYGHKIRYYQDPELSRRAAIPPPTEFSRIIQKPAEVEHVAGDATARVEPVPEPPAATDWPV